MKKQYTEVLNQGNQALNIGPSISVEESPRGVASYEDIAKHMEHISHGVVNKSLAQMVIGVYNEAVLDLIATHDLRVPMYDTQRKQLGQFYGDMRLDQNISEAEARRRKPELGNAPLTKDNIANIVNPADVKTRFKFETEKVGTDTLVAMMEGVEKSGVNEKPYVARKENQGGNQGGNGGNNPDDGTLG